MSSREISTEKSSNLRASPVKPDVLQRARAGLLPALKKIDVRIQSERVSTPLIVLLSHLTKGMRVEIMDSRERAYKNSSCELFLHFL